MNFKKIYVIICLLSIEQTKGMELSKISKENRNIENLTSGTETFSLRGPSGDKSGDKFLANFETKFKQLNHDETNAVVSSAKLFGKMKKTVAKGMSIYEIINNDYEVNNADLHEFLYTKIKENIANLIWFFYALAIKEDQYFNEGTFIIEDPNFVIYNFLSLDKSVVNIPSPKTYAQIAKSLLSSTKHFQNYYDFLGESSYDAHNDEDILSIINSRKYITIEGLPTGKPNLLFGKLETKEEDKGKDLIFIKPVDYSLVKGLQTFVECANVIQRNLPGTIESLKSLQNYVTGNSSGLVQSTLPLLLSHFSSRSPLIAFCTSLLNSVPLIIKNNPGILEEEKEESSQVQVNENQVAQILPPVLEIAAKNKQEYSRREYLANNDKFFLKLTNEFKILGINQDLFKKLGIHYLIINLISILNGSYVKVLTALNKELDGSTFQESNLNYLTDKIKEVEGNDPEKQNENFSEKQEKALELLIEIAKKWNHLGIRFGNEVIFTVDQELKLFYLPPYKKPVLQLEQGANINQELKQELKEKNNNTDID